MDEEGTCNLQKNQQSSKVRVSKRFVQRSKAVLPASKRNLQNRKMKVGNDVDVLSGEESIDTKSDEVYVLPTLSAKRIDPENNPDLLKVVPSSCCETCLTTSEDGNEIISIKEETTDTQEGEVPLRVSLPIIMAKRGNTPTDHRSARAEERLYSCGVCDKTFCHLSKLKRHHLVHTGERPYFCEVCTKSFSDLGKLKRHVAIHTGERLYSCDVCNKSFSDQSNMKKHQRIHSGERPFSCDICNKSFSVQGTLKTHKRVHSGERPYTCDVCNKSFRYHCNLKTHERIHTGERPYSCEVCHRSFSEQSTLKKHHRVHRGKRANSRDV
jgi:stress-induced morphogen